MYEDLTNTAIRNRKQKYLENKSLFDTTTFITRQNESKIFHEILHPGMSITTLGIKLLRMLDSVISNPADRQIYYCVTSVSPTGESFPHELLPVLYEFTQLMKKFPHVQKVQLQEYKDKLQGAQYEMSSK